MDSPMLSTSDITGILQLCIGVLGVLLTVSGINYTREWRLRKTRSKVPDEESLAIKPDIDATQDSADVQNSSIAAYPARLQMPPPAKIKLNGRGPYIVVINDGRIVSGGVWALEKGNW